MKGKVRREPPLAMWEAAICAIRAEIRSHDIMNYAIAVCDALENSMVQFAKNENIVDIDLEQGDTMLFDKSRVFTVLNADELRAGDKVIVADTMQGLKENVSKRYNIKLLTHIYGEDCEARFQIEGCSGYALAYLVEREENCTNCVYDGCAGCSVVDITKVDKKTHHCSGYERKEADEQAGTSTFFFRSGNDDGSLCGAEE